jgi:hypothetical protein
MSEPTRPPNPIIPGSTYRVHDKTRPIPRVVNPGNNLLDETKAAGVPSDATVLFDGTDLSGWQGRDGGEAPWDAKNGYMEVVPGSGNIKTREVFGDCQLHLEWSASTTYEKDGQGRSNSGVYMMGIYEIQILDCYENPTYADGTTAALYGQCPPLVNACRKPGEWQSYDIIWVAPRFDGEELLSPARATVLHNGVVVHHDRALTGPTIHVTVLPYKPHAAEGPLELQEHKDKVRFRNIWYRPLKDYDEA